MIRDGQISGECPGQIHDGVAWWVGACFVAVAKTSRLAVAHDGRTHTGTFHLRFLQGAINSGHWACEVTDVGAADEAGLLHAMTTLGGVPGAFLATSGDRSPLMLGIRLYDADGRSVEDHNGLGDIRDMIDADRVPLPVNDACKGRVIGRPDLIGADR
ncbi:hypothetical protein ACIBEA_37195 [Streptomyces sp. NPDC051555]|uniref:hypothetical protein n=1 Tax=Streptomyces sp. NPDC051555 TaxID=3365657 RepID=UPI0037B101C2